MKNRVYPSVRYTEVPKGPDDFFLFVRIWECRIRLDRAKRIKKRP